MQSKKFALIYYFLTKYSFQNLPNGEVGFCFTPGERKTSARLTIFSSNGVKTAVDPVYEPNDGGNLLAQEIDAFVVEMQEVRAG